MSVQRLLFDDLPESEPARKPRRGRAAAAGAAPSTMAAQVAVDMVREAAPRPRASAMAVNVATLPLAPPAPLPPPPAFDPAALSNPELRALVQALPDQRLAHLLIEAARELKRRAAPDPGDADGEDGDVPMEPNPALLRAARQAVGELSGEDF
ncbi:hypothetical protein TSH100_15720 [Azospirillum sp. TSH100]|uniref:hypothetical protein n=1 Tax=Azospirillum sp. TSH100 TaxID=652764 RepID=UPI000D608360|nr:hypothetical protein [Azospirillum sp. TSH100]PWC85371.1 hypothetical protein TSH100_15720 [Azospirillum sp. TSH100]QCG86490.1 hypothetical protein E6C72_01330 [Azospirillum sp. TSH100]